MSSLPLFNAIGKSGYDHLNLVQGFNITFKPWVSIKMTFNLNLIFLEKLESFWMMRK